MPKPLLIPLVVVFFLLPCFSQSLNDPLSQGTQSQSTALDCSDPTMASSPQCIAAQAQRSNGVQTGDNSSSPIRTPVLTNPLGFSADQYTPTKPPLNPSQMWHPQAPTRPETEFEQMVADSVGR